MGYVVFAAGSWAMGQTIWPAAPAGSVDLASLPPVIRGPVIPTLPTVVLPPPVVLPAGEIRVFPPVVLPGSVIPLPPPVEVPPLVLPPVVVGPGQVIYPRLITYPGRLGVEVVDHQPHGARVVGVWLDSPAARLRDSQTGQLCRLEPGDVILAVDGIQVRSAADLARLIQTAPPRTVLTIRDCRSGQIAHLIAELPQLHEELRIPIHSGESRKIFPGRQVAELRHRADQARQIPTDLVPGGGWHQSPTDPMDLVGVFSTLKVKESYRLVGYVDQFRAVVLGRVVAVPRNAKLPEPERHTPIPVNVPGLVEDPMEVIQGDGSAWSYLEASILRRELAAFEVPWGEDWWSYHTILGDNPLQVAGAWSILPNPFGELNILPPKPGDLDWRWLEPAMKDPSAHWAPTVYLSPHRVRVVFYTYSPMSSEGIYRHEDTYRTGLYRPLSSSTTKIAEGSKGLVVCY